MVTKSIQSKTNIFISILIFSSSLEKRFPIFPSTTNIERQESNLSDNKVCINFSIRITAIPLKDSYANVNSKIYAKIPFGFIVNNSCMLIMRTIFECLLL